MADSNEELIARLSLHRSWRDSQGELNDAPNEAAAALKTLVEENKVLRAALEIVDGGCVDISDTAIIVGDGAKTVKAQVRQALSQGSERDHP